MTTLRREHLAAFAVVVAAGAGISVPALRILQDAHGADDVVEGFFPSLCAGEMPPAELLALADWPLDAEGIGCRPHAGVLAAVSETSTQGGRAGAISRALAEYVLSLDATPKANKDAPEPQVARTAGQRDALAERGEPATATAFAVDAAGSYEAVPLAALNKEDAPAAAQPRRYATAETSPEPAGSAALPGQAAALPAVADAAPSVSQPEPILFSGLLVADAALDEMRGGFETPGGLELSFGIERVVYINGELSSTTTLNVADLSQLVGGAAGVQNLPVGTNVAVIQNGPNNTFDASVLASGAFATVIQNSLNNQRIQTTTTINAQVNSVDLLQANRFNDSLRNAVNASMLR
jgi:hypothetical protein